MHIDFMRTTAYKRKSKAICDELGDFPCKKLKKIKIVIMYFTHFMQTYCEKMIKFPTIQMNTIFLPTFLFILKIYLKI